jgi:hypothetical protein
VVLFVALTLVQAQKKVAALYASLQRRRHSNADRTGIDDLLDYYRGKHPLAYATDQWRGQHEARFKRFSDNWCGVVGSAPSERRAVDGFRVGTDNDVFSDDEKQLWRDWDVNEMPSQASQGFLMSDVARRSAVLVWGDENDEPEVTWERPDQIIVEHAPSGRRRARYALKVWLDDDRELATLYAPDEVWKFERARTVGQVVNGQTESGLYVSGQVDLAGAGGWVERTDHGDDVWPLPNPFGEVPVVEFANRPLLGGEAVSEIEGTKAMQDAINVFWAYLFVAADWASMPARVVMGQEPPKIPVLDDNGQKIGERPVDEKALTTGRLLWLTGQNTKVGQWDAAKLDVFTGVINVAVKHVAAQTRTPIHYIVGELGNVNGETLTATETPLAMKAREGNGAYTPRVRDVFRLMALVRNNKGLADACRYGQVQWRNPETRSEAQLADAALKDRQRGLPLAYILEKRDGLSQPEIDRVMGMVAAEQAMDPVAAAARALSDPMQGGSGDPAGGS